MSARRKGRFEFPKARGSADRFRFTAAPSTRRRLDRFLMERFTGFSRTFLQSVIREGKVLVNGRAAKASHMVARGDEITILLDEPGGRQPEDLPLEVLHEDAHILVINKAAGMVVHPARGNLSGTVYNALLYRYREERAGDPDFFLGSVHRLDEDTSGVMVYPRTKGAARSLTRQFEDRAVSKEYLLIVHGAPAFEQLDVKAPLGTHPQDRTRVAVDGVHARPAHTRFLVHSRSDAAVIEAAVLRAFPRTGRGHQVRVHALSVGHVIVGDWRYGGRKETAGGEPLIARQALHAAVLKFRHPGTGEHVTMRAPVPGDMLRLAERLKLDLPG